MCVSYGLCYYTLLYYSRPYETEFIGGMFGVSSLLPLSHDIVYFTLLGLNKLKMFSTGQRIFPVGIAIFKNKELPVYT